MIAVYLIFRVTIFRESVLFPTEIYKQVKWREKLSKIFSEYFVPAIMNILLIIMIRLFFFAIVDIFANASSSLGSMVSYSIIACYSGFNILAFYTLFFKQSNSTIKYFFIYELKKDS